MSSLSWSTLGGHSFMPWFSNLEVREPSLHLPEQIKGVSQLPSSQIGFHEHLPSVQGLSRAQRNFCQKVDGCRQHISSDKRMRCLEASQSLSSMHQQQNAHRPFAVLSPQHVKKKFPRHSPYALDYSAKLCHAKCLSGSSIAWIPFLCSCITVLKRKLLHLLRLFQTCLSFPKIKS